MYTYINIYIHMYTYIYICTCVCTCMCVYIHTCVHMHMYIYTHVCVCMYIMYALACRFSAKINSGARSSVRFNQIWKFYFCESLRCDRKLFLGDAWSHVRYDSFNVRNAQHQLPDHITMLNLWFIDEFSKWHYWEKRFFAFSHRRVSYARLRS